MSSGGVWGVREWGGGGGGADQDENQNSELKAIHIEHSSVVQKAIYD